MAGPLKRSPLAPAETPAVAPVGGVRLAAVAAGVRYTTGRLDVMLAELAPGAAVAGVFTRSLTRAAPVLWCEAALAAHAAAGPATAPTAIIVNAGNANAFTGAAGADGAARMAAVGAAAVGGEAAASYVASTGVIGEPLDAARVEAAADALRAGLRADGWVDAAAAIMTTDTFPKLACRQIMLDGRRVTISGFTKGSGMIAPDMATMLGFVFTDAPVAQPLLQKLLSEITEQTFNAITVDSDTSTSDTVLLAATGAAGGSLIADAQDPRLPPLAEALRAVMLDLAHQIVRDGEGATKFVAVTVTGAATDAAAKRIGLSIANSPLVKTAIAGEDPNWGRIVMAVGKAGETADRDRLTIRFGNVLVAEKGRVAATYAEADAVAYMKNAELAIAVDVGVGAGTATVWTCDLTHGYIAINADYRS